MAFSVNQLQASIFAGRQMSIGQTALAEAAQRLSSGLRVNHAADDAASLGISEQIRSQVSGLSRSVRNAQDVISMVQTTEGSLTQVSDMLRQMRDLAVKGRNGSLSLSQRNGISQELLQLRDEINKIADRTSFNSNSLLKNSLGAAVANSFSDSGQFKQGAEVLNGLSIDHLDVYGASVGDYAVSFSAPKAIANQISRVTTKLSGSEGSNNTQAATVTGSGTAEAVITLAGVFEAGDQIRFTAKGDNPDRTLVQTYVVTAENLTKNNDGLSATVTGDSATAHENIARGMAAQYNLANAVGIAADVDSDGSGGKDGKFSKPDATAVGGTVKFSGNNVNLSALTSVTVGAQTFNRQDQARTITPTINDLGEGNRISFSINGKSYTYVVASDSTTESVAEGLRQRVLKDYPDTATRAGSILTIESGAGITTADLDYRVYKPLDQDLVTNIASTVSRTGATRSSSRQITIDELDVIAGRKFTVDFGNPQQHVNFSLIAGSDDTRVSVANKLAQRLGEFFGSGPSAVSASDGTITFSSSLGVGLSNITLSVRETARGVENPIVSPSRGITSAVWGVGGRLDDGQYELFYNGTSWQVLRDPVAGFTSTFTGSVLTTSPGNRVNVTLSGTPKAGDRIFFDIADGDPERNIGLQQSAGIATGQDISGVWNDTKVKVTNVVGDSLAAGTYRMAYNGSSWSVTSSPVNSSYNGTTLQNDPYLNFSRSSLSNDVYSGDTLTFDFTSGTAGTVKINRSMGISGASQNYIWNNRSTTSTSTTLRFSGSQWVKESGDGSIDIWNTTATSIRLDVPDNDIGVTTTGTPKEGDHLLVSYTAATYHWWGALNNPGSVTGTALNNDRDDYSVAISTAGTTEVFDTTPNYVFTNVGGVASNWSSNNASASYNGSQLRYTAKETLTVQPAQGNLSEPPDDGDWATSVRSPIDGDVITLTVDNSGNVAVSAKNYERTGVTAVDFAVAGSLDSGDYTLEYNGSTTASDYTIKNRFGDAVATATYAAGWLTLDSGDRVELTLTGTPKVGDKVYFTLTPGNVITDRVVEGSNIGGLETSVSSQHRDRSDRVITIDQTDLAVGRSVGITIGGKEYAVRVETADNAESIASRLAGLMKADYPNNSSVNDSPELPAASRITVLDNKITLQEPAKLGIDDIVVSIREITNPGLITLTAMSNTGLAGKSQSLLIGEIPSGASKSYRFDDLGISFSLKNSRLVAANEESFSAYVSPITTLAVGSLRQGATVQLGASVSSGEQSTIVGFKDIRISGENKNTGAEKAAFDNLSAALEAISANTEEALSASNFGSVESFVDSVIDRVSAIRAGLGAQQVGLEYAIGGLENSHANLAETNTRIVGTDYAVELARLTRIQIGQQAASAMLAQGNVLPEIILSMLQTQPA